MLPYSRELVVRRVRRVKQRVVANPRNNSQLIAGLFGQSNCDDEPTIEASGEFTASANPWAQPCLADFQACRAIDEGDILADLMDRRPLSVFSEYSEEFLNIDIAKLRAQYFFVSVPPPGFVLGPSEEDDFLEGEKLFTCKVVVEGGYVCGAAF